MRPSAVQCNAVYSAAGFAAARRGKGPAEKLDGEAQMLARKRDSKVTARFKKGRLRIAVACCIACSTWLASSSSIFSQQKKSVVYRGIVAIDDAQFSDGKLCVPLQVAMTSDDFFQGLRASA